MELTKRGRLYFGLIKSYQKLAAKGPNPLVRQKTHLEKRYSLYLSNRAFKAKWIRENGSIKGLNHVPRRDITVKDRTVTFLTEHYRALRELDRKITNLHRKLYKLQVLVKEDRNSPKFRVSTRKLKIPSLNDRDAATGSTPVLERRSVPRYSNGRKRIAGINYDPIFGYFLSIPGGVTLTLSESEIRKYGYFHDRYGDEAYLSVDHVHYRLFASEKIWRQIVYDVITSTHQVV
jgi:hypothetical protein